MYDKEKTGIRDPRQPQVNSSGPCSYLERPHDKFEDYFHLGLKVVREEGKHDIVNSKQGDEQKCGLGQPPGDRERQGVGMYSHTGRWAWAYQMLIVTRSCEDKQWLSPPPRHAHSTPVPCLSVFLPVCPPTSLPGESTQEN